MPTWTTPAKIVEQVRRRWDDGRLLRSRLSGEPIFPFHVRFSGPSASDLRERFGEVQQWVQRLRDESREHQRFGFELQWTERNDRQVGRNNVPSGAIVPTEEDALRMIQRHREGDDFQHIVETTILEFPALRDWLARRPHKALDEAVNWHRVLAVLRWFAAHPRSGLYLRQLDLPGVDTKFIEQRLGLFSELLQQVLPPDTVDSRSTCAFEERFGLRSKPVRIRLRFLDERLYLHGLEDVSAPVSQIARLPLPPKRVFITENEINGLAFPMLSDSLVVFGLGYGVDRLRDLHWLRHAEVHYWGDIDTHGFSILDSVRAIVSQTTSILMDRATLSGHRELWGRELEQHIAPLGNLNEEEASLYDDLRMNHLAQGVRLEQEQIPFGWVQRALARVA